jgi:hypothetical protein
MASIHSGLKRVTEEYFSFIGILLSRAETIHYRNEISVIREQIVPGTLYSTDKN